MQYEMNDGTMIVGIDHGYGNIKTANTIFSNQLLVKNTEPIMTDDYIEFDGKYYILNEGHKNYISDKIKDDDYYILTLAAIAKELRRRGVFEQTIYLAVGLPLKWLSAQKDDFRKYLMRNQAVKFKYKKQNYSIGIKGCSVMPQCYSAVINKLQEFKGLNMIADIGNGTMNVMFLMDGKGQEGKYWTEVMGVKECALNIHQAVLDKFQVELPEVLINSYLMSGKADLAYEYLAIMSIETKKYVKSIFDKLQECGYNKELMKLYFMGGGARLVELFGDYDKEKVFFQHDIHANAKGYEHFCYLALCNSSV